MHVGAQQELQPVWSQPCTGPVQHVAVSPTGLVAVSTPSAIAVLQAAETSQLKFEISCTDSAVQQIAFCGSKEVLVGLTEDKTVRWWDMESGEQTTCRTAAELSDSAVPAEAHTSLAASSSGNFVAVSLDRYLCCSASCSVCAP